MSQNNSIKINESEMAEIRLLQGKFQELHQRFGSLYIEKMQLDTLVNEFLTKEKTCKEEWANIQKLEQTLMENLSKNYGEGSLNMTDGTFIPSKTK